MRRLFILTFIIAAMAMLFTQCSQVEAPQERKISVEDYVDKMKAGWVGQMIGVGWGAPTEFKYNGVMIPDTLVPVYENKMVNQFGQDDIYVEMTFLKTLEDYGFDVSIRQAGIDFANSLYALWHANLAGRNNLRQGIAPPASGHPQYNSHADDIDYQIEADYAGLITPGMPNIGIELGDKFGRIMNYGDGLYGGLFVTGMYSEAFFEKDINKIIDAGLKCVPQGSQYHEMIGDVRKWHAANPTDWRKTWDEIDTKYQKNADYRNFSCSDVNEPFNIDVKINGAYIVLGLLYGNGNIDSTTVISMQAGADSDCNPSNAAGILCTSMGLEALPAKYKEELDMETKFSFTVYNFPELVDVCEKLARQAVERAGGRVEKNEAGVEELVIPIVAVNTPVLEQCSNPGPLGADSLYTEEEMEQIRVKFRPAEDYAAEWLVSEAYSNEELDNEALLTTPFAPENGEDVTWSPMPITKANYMAYCNFSEVLGGESRVVYIKNTIVADTAQMAYFLIGSDDGIKVWINDELLLENNAFRGLTIDSDTIPVNLNAGDNKCLIKITQGTGGWELVARMTNKEGDTKKNITYRAE